MREMKALLLETAIPWVQALTPADITKVTLGSLIGSSKEFKEVGATFMEAVVEKTTKLPLDDNTYRPFVQSLMDHVSQNASTDAQDNFLRMRLLLTALGSWAANKETVAQLISQVVAGLGQVRVCDLAVPYICTLKKKMGGDVPQLLDVITQLRTHARMPAGSHTPAGALNVDEDELELFKQYRENLRGAMRELITTTQETEFMVKQCVSVMKECQAQRKFEKVQTEGSRIRGKMVTKWDSIRNGQMGIDLQPVDVVYTPVAKAGRALSVLPAFILHTRRGLRRPVY